jgi:release factor glutamine methyltransferase
MDTRTLLRQSTERLIKAGSNSPQLDAQLLLAATLKISRSKLLASSETNLTEKQAEKFERLLHKREDGAPIAHLVGYQEFFGRNFVVNQHTLVPRPETELLIEEAVRPLSYSQFWSYSGCRNWLGLHCHNYIY